MKVPLTLAIAALFALPAQASRHHWNSISCKGTILATEQSFERSQGEEQSKRIVGHEELEEGRHFELLDDASETVVSQQSELSEVACYRDGDENQEYSLKLGRSEKKSLVKQSLRFANTEEVPANLRGQTLTDTLACLEISSETDTDCP